MVNAAFIALGAANPGLLPLAFSSTPSQGSSSHRRYVRAMLEEEDRRREERNEYRRRNARFIPADIRGLDPEEDGWLIAEIIEARSLDEQIAAAELAVVRTKREMKQSAYDLGLDPEEDGWLIDEIRAGVSVAQAQQHLSDLKTQAWAERLINDTESRP